MPTGPDSLDNKTCFFCAGKGQIPVEIQGEPDSITCGECHGAGDLIAWRIK